MFDKDNKFGFINNNENNNNSDIKKYIDDKTSILPIKNSYTIFKDSVPSLKQDTVTAYGVGGDGACKVYVFNNLQNTDMIVDSPEFNLIISFNDGTADITKNIVYKNNRGTSFGTYEDDYMVNLDYSADRNLIEVSVTKDVLTDTGYQETPCTITKATFICSLYSNLLQNYVIEDIKYKQIIQVPDKLDGLATGRYEVFNNEDYYYLCDNSFVWDMNRINERLDENSGVKQNTTVSTIARTVIKVNQKDSEGIGFGQLVPINNKRDVSIIAKAGVDVILKAYNPNTKKLLLTMNFRDRNSFEVIKGYISKNQLSGLNNIFIAFTTTETPANYDFNSNVDYLVVTDEYTFLKRAEVLTKENTKEYIPTGDYNPATKKYVDDNTPIKSLPVNPTTKTGAVVVINNITSSGCYALPKRTDGKYWTNLIMRVMPSDGSGKGKAIMLNGYQNYVFYVNIETKKIYCDNLRIVYKIGATDDTIGTTDIYTEPYFLPTTNTKEYTPTKEYHPATKKYVDDNKQIKYIEPTDFANFVELTKSGGFFYINNTVDINYSSDYDSLPYGLYHVKNIADNGYLYYNYDDACAIITDGDNNIRNMKGLMSSLPVDLTLDSSTNLLQLIGSSGTALGEGITLPKDIKYIEPTNFANFVELTKEEGFYYVSPNTNASINYNDNSYTISGLYNVYKLASDYRYYSYNNMYKFAVNKSNNVTDFTSIPEELFTYIMEELAKELTDMIPYEGLVTIAVQNNVLTLTEDKHQTATITNGVEIKLPTVTEFTEIHLFFSTTQDLTLTLPVCKWQDGKTPTFSANATYEFIFTYIGTQWLARYIEYK